MTTTQQSSQDQESSSNIPAQAQGALDAVGDTDTTTPAAATTIFAVAEASFKADKTGAEAKMTVPGTSADKLISHASALALPAILIVGIVLTITYGKNSGLPGPVESAVVLILALAVALIAVVRTLGKDH
ncbi:hypothetical protein E6W39_06530 [Kitasatospora acidiphila]|uniref:Uncharacterized protein n=1 Tax=Kitasatospora acidiphila TaxID=2567942 RepID=A0A540VZ28_9ACTN|nr:hypothetical protein [Kitasatospora acidiphila]TQF01993.1 hypothetical protein E6W39_06530 [Kitasatospora acidiphila]